MKYETQYYDNIPWRKQLATVSKTTVFVWAWTPFVFRFDGDTYRTTEANLVQFGREIDHGVNYTQRMK